MLRHILPALLLAFLSVATTPLSVAAQTPIEAVRIDGNKRIDTATVRSYLTVTAGDSFSDDTLDINLKRLFATGLFADVKLAREGDVLVVQVVENPVINRLVFEGNETLKDDTLLPEVQLRPRTVFTRARVQSDVERLLEVYRRNGRYAAVIDPKIIQLDQNRVDLVFEINEGARTKIRSVRFIGNRDFTASSLRSIISTKESAWYRLFSSDDTYDPDRLAYDEELLRQHYLEQGYLDFSVRNTLATLSPDNSGFHITFTIEEGKRYRLGSVDVISRVRELSPQAVQEHVSLGSGDWYNQKLLNSSIDKITDVLGNLGYAFVNIVPDIEKIPAAGDKESPIANLTLTLEEGAKVYVERIDIRGNVRTLDRVVRREFALAEGDAYNSDRLKRSERDLKNLGYFENVTIDTQQGSSPDKIIIGAEVEEQSTGELSFGAGFSSTESLLGDVRLRERNFLGRGQDVRVATTFSAKRQELDFSFTEPYFLGRDLSAGIDLFRVTRRFQRESSYDESRTGGGLNLGYNISEYLSQTLRYVVRNVSIGNIQDNASRFIRDQEGTALTSAVGHELLYDRRDNRFEPNNGYYARLGNEVAGLGGDVNYIKSTIGSGFYTPLPYDEWVFGMTTEAGYVVDWGDDNDVRINDRFFIGGANLRGFELAGIGPRDQASNDALGGDLYFTTSAELRFPLGLPEELGITGRAFTDAGTLVNRNKSEAGVLDSGLMRVSAGVGLSWRSPFGPVRVDFAQAISKEDYDETEFFRFSFGTQF